MAIGLQRCLGYAGQRCGVLVQHGNRCGEHTRVVARAKRQRRPRLAGEDERRAQAVWAHVTQHGWLCPGWRREPHPSTDLTADHVHSYARTRDEHGPLEVLCRSCNSAKGAGNAA